MYGWYVYTVPYLQYMGLQVPVQEASVYSEGGYCTMVCVYALHFGMCVREGICFTTCKCIYVHTYECTYVCMYVCMYVRTYVRKYVCMYVCMYILYMYVCMYVCTINECTGFLSLGMFGKSPAPSYVPFSLHHTPTNSAYCCTLCDCL